MKADDYTRKISIFLLSTFGSSLMVNGVEAFNSATHKYVTTSSLEFIKEKSSGILGEERKLNEKENSILKEISEEYKEHIIEYSLKPDEDENQGAFKYHFFNPVTERNFLGERKTALSKYKDHFEKALENYKNGNKSDAYEQLGRAIHFLEDLSTAVHTGYDSPTDSVVKFPLHVSFEKKCDNINTECKPNITAEGLDYYESNLAENIAKSIAFLSMDNFYRLEHVEMEDENELPRNAVLNAQNRITGIIYKFIKEAAKLV